MKSGFLYSIAAALSAAALPAPAGTLEFDVVVSGGSFSAVAAAFAAARDNPSAQVLLIEPTDWLGGQATSQGVAAIDNPHHAPAASLIANNPATYYPADYNAFLTAMKNAPASAPGEGYAGYSGWVSRDCYDPRTAAWVLDNQAAAFSNLTVMKLTVVKDVATSTVSDSHGTGLSIDSMTLIERTPVPGYTPFDDFLSEELLDWYSPTDSSRFTKLTHTVIPRDSQRGLVAIDASELGDLMVLSGAKYTQGREVTTEKIAEDGTLPAINDAEPMAMVYPFCMTTSAVTDTESELKNPWPDFDAFLAERTANYFSLSTYSWAQVFTYRRLLANGGTGQSTITAGDVSMQNWNPGNDYRQGPWLLGKSATDAQAATDWVGGTNLASLRLAEEQAVAWYFWLKQRTPAATPGVDTRLLRGNDPLNMMGSGHGLAKFPYIRGTRRLVGLENFRITSRYWRNTGAADYANGTSFRYFDSVGIGNYASDVRPLLSSTGMVPPYGSPAPFYIPYRALASENVRNLLACGKTMAQTYVTNSGYRLHPIEWASGSAAGSAAALMVRDSIANHELLPIPALRELQTNIAANSPIRWAYTGETVLPAEDGDLVVNDFNPLAQFAPFVVEAYHPTAVRAEISANLIPLGSTTLRSNGRLVFNSTGVDFAADVYTFTVELYDGENHPIATLTTNVTGAGIACELEGGVTDNDDSDGYFTTTGSWGSASAQADRWCPDKPGGGTYTLINNNDGNRVARWRLRTTVRGEYEVALWYPAANNRPTDARFTVNHADGSTPISVNQRINGGRWFVLGTFPFSGTAADTVELRNAHTASDAYVIADAVRVRLIAPAESPAEMWIVN